MLVIRENATFSLHEMVFTDNSSAAADALGASANKVNNPVKAQIESRSTFCRLPRKFCSKVMACTSFLVK